MSEEAQVQSRSQDALTRAILKYSSRVGGDSVLGGRHKKEVELAVQYQCGDACCQATNAEFAEVIDGVLVLVGEDNGFIKVKCFKDDKKPVCCQLVKVLIIPLDRICAVGLFPLDLCECDD
jgi:hypothetical protein